MSKRQGGPGDEGIDEGENGTEEWWQAADPEKVSQFLQQWQNWMANNNHDKNLVAWESLQKQAIAGFQDFWEKSLNEPSSSNTDNLNESQTTRADKANEKHQPSLDAIMGVVLHLLQRQDSLEERLRKLENSQDQKQGVVF